MAVGGHGKNGEPFSHAYFKTGNEPLTNQHIPALGFFFQGEM